MTKQIKEKHAKRFDGWSRSYDKTVLNHFVFNTTHKMFLKEIDPFIKQGSNVLDIGCGTGRLAYRLLDLGRDMNIHGLDISEEMIGAAKSKPQNRWVDFKVGDVEELPYEADTFDIITCAHSFHHYPDQKKALTEMHRVLKDGGKLMIIDGHPDKFLGKIIFGIVTILEGDVYHVYQRELRDMLLSIGFDYIVQKKFNPIAPLLFTLGHAAK